MLKIKLQRKGKKNQALYRIVVAEARSKVSGRYIDLLGTYNPNTDPAVFDLDQKKYQQWLKKGAQPTVTIRRLAKQL